MYAGRNKLGKNPRRGAGIGQVGRLQQACRERQPPGQPSRRVDVGRPVYGEHQQLVVRLGAVARQAAVEGAMGKGSLPALLTRARTCG